MLQARHAEILAALDHVLDPELDRSVVGMGFIHEIRVAGGDVHVSFRLPTHWCAAAFAFMMAADMRAAIGSLPWVESAVIRLLDHFAAGRINRVIAARGDFADAFPGEPSGDLAGLRQRFLEKAFLGRQERLLRALIAKQGADAALSLHIAGLEALARENADALRYLTIRRQFGGPATPDAPAFSDLHGVPVTAAGHVAHLRAIRRTRSEADANAEHCSLLLQARQLAPAPDDRISPPGIYE